MSDGTEIAIKAEAKPIRVLLLDDLEDNLLVRSNSAAEGLRRGDLGFDRGSRVQAQRH